MIQSVVEAEKMLAAVRLVLAEESEDGGKAEAIAVKTIIEQEVEIERLRSALAEQKASVASLKTEQKASVARLKTEQEESLASLKTELQTQKTSRERAERAEAVALARAQAADAALSGMAEKHRASIERLERAVQKINVVVPQAAKPISTKGMTFDARKVMDGHWIINLKE